MIGALGLGEGVSFSLPLSTLLDATELVTDGARRLGVIEGALGETGDRKEDVVDFREETEDATEGARERRGDGLVIFLPVAVAVLRTVLTLRELLALFLLLRVPAEAVWKSPEVALLRREESVVAVLIRTDGGLAFRVADIVLLTDELVIELRVEDAEDLGRDKLETMVADVTLDARLRRSVCVGETVNDAEGGGAAVGVDLMFMASTSSSSSSISMSISILSVPSTTTTGGGMIPDSLESGRSFRILVGVPARDLDLVVEGDRGILLVGVLERTDDAMDDLPTDDATEDLATEDRDTVDLPDMALRNVGTRLLCPTLLMDEAVLRTEGAALRIEAATDRALESTSFLLGVFPGAGPGPRISSGDMSITDRCASDSALSCTYGGTYNRQLP